MQGLLECSKGPALLDFSELMNVDLATISYLFITRSVGSILGAFGSKCFIFTLENGNLSLIFCFHLTTIVPAVNTENDLIVKNPAQTHFSIWSPYPYPCRWHHHRQVYPTKILPSGVLHCPAGNVQRAPDVLKSVGLFPALLFQRSCHWSHRLGWKCPQPCHLARPRGRTLDAPAAL